MTASTVDESGDSFDFELYLLLMFVNAQTSALRCAIVRQVAAIPFYLTYKLTVKRALADCAIIYFCKYTLYSTYDRYFVHFFPLLAKSRNVIEIFRYKQNWSISFERV